MTFLLERQAMFGQEPPINARSTTTARSPVFAIVQARYFPDSPLPSTRMSQRCVSIIVGISFFSGLSDPVEVFQAVQHRVVGLVFAFTYAVALDFIELLDKLRGDLIGH
jgi:hypothetical protein